MRAVSGILGALCLLLLLAAAGSAMAWFDPAFPGDASKWPVFVGLAAICAVLSVFIFRQSKK